MNYIIKNNELRKTVLEELSKLIKIKCELCRTSNKVARMTTTNYYYTTQERFAKYSTEFMTKYNKIYHEILETSSEGTLIVHMVPCTAQKEQLEAAFYMGLTHKNESLEIED